jgi:PKD repeat protein
VTFNANVTGRPQLTYNWKVLDSNNLPVAGPSAGDKSYVWSSAAGMSPGTYTGQVTVSNPSSPGGVPFSKQIQLVALPPLADISGLTPTAAFTSNTVQFTAPDVTGATTIVWDYGDGTPPVTFTDPVAGRTPTHTYAAPGTYNAKVTISNCVNTQGSTSKTVPVTITIQVTASFHASLFCQAGGCFATTGVPINFSDASVGASTWDYDWNHADSSPGTCNFTDTGHTAAVTLHTYDSPGTFYPCLRVKLGAAQNVAVHSPQIIVQTITQPPPPPTISVSGPTTGQPNQAYAFSASATNCTPSATGWSWSVGGGTIAGSSTGSSISVSWSTPGLKTISAANSGCSGASGGAASINLSPVNGGVLQALFTFSPAAPKAGDVVSFDSSSSTNVPAGASLGWSFGDGSSTSGAIVNHAFTSAATYTVTLTITPAGCISPSCLAQTSKPVVVVPNGGPQFTVSPVSPASSDPAIFDASASTNIPAGSQFGWSFGDNSPSGFGTVVSHTFAAPGTFNVVLAVSPPGCSTTSCLLLASKTVVVVPGNGVHFTVSPESPSATQAATFDASSSTNVPAGALFGWDFGDHSGPSFGKVVTHTYAQQGSYNVSLSIAPPGCGSVSCLALAGRTVTIGPPPPVSADFSPDVACSNGQCQAQTAKAVTLTATAADGTSYAWNFGDNSTDSGRQVTHTWAQPGSYTVSLTVTKGFLSATKSLGFVVTGPPPPKTKTTLLPLATQSRGVLVQSNDLYVYNPGTTPLDVTLEFRKRGTPDVNPPRSVSTLQPGATLFAPDMLSSLFNVENVAGFITVVTGLDSVQPVITSFNSQGVTASKLFGLTIPGSAVGTAGSASSSGPAGSQFLVGLHDSPDRQSSFGFSNPTDETATYHLRFFDKTGRLLTESSDLTLSGHDQRQFSVQEIRDSFGINNLDDYRVEVKNVSGAQVFPFGSDVRVVTGDPSFTEAGTYTMPRLYLLGVFTGAGAAKSTWQTDLLLSNVSDQVIQTTLAFTAVSTKAGVKATQVTLQPGMTERLENALFSQFGLRNGTGVLTLTSTSPNNIFPIARAESYDNTNPSKRYGQSLIALSDTDAADTTKKEVLVGLRQDGSNKTTLWLLNPSGTAGLYDLVYRGLNGAVLGTLPGIKIGAGQLHQISPSQHPIKRTGVPGGFTVEVVVKSGKALAAAQVVRAGSNDPVFVAAQVR